jgi:hypothetical protein
MIDARIIIMETKIKFWHILAVTLLVTLLQTFAVVSGHYDGDKIFIDKIEHILGGVGFGLFWLWVLNQRAWSGSLPLVALSTVMFALFGSFIWELFEFFVSANLAEVSTTLKLYSPHLRDALEDMTSGLLGGIVVSLVYLYEKNSPKTGK